MHRTRPLQPDFGVEVLRADLEKIDPEGCRDRLLELWRVHGLLLFRGQTLSETRQREIGELFGENNTHSARSGVSYLSTRDRTPAASGPLIFHSDLTAWERPMKAIMLFAVEVPSRGGATLFADTATAHVRLPEELRRCTEGLSALHVSDTTLGYAVRYRDRDAGPDADRAIHPVSARHPDTGKSLLFVNRQMCDSIVGLDERESEELLEKLFACLYAPENVYRHVWRVGDLLLWDNLRIQHCREDFDASEPRTLRRLTTAGEPIAPAVTEARAASET